MLSARLPSPANFPHPSGLNSRRTVRVALSGLLALALTIPPACHRRTAIEPEFAAQTGYESISTAQLRAPKLAPGAERYWSRGKQYMIATDSPEASRAGAAMYAAGGNAVDAAIAVSFAISVVRPQSTGLGGGGFMLVHLAARNETIAYDFRERAPAAATRDMYLDRDGNVIKGASLNGAGAAGVPGMIAGLVEVHRRHGSLPLADVIAPALSLARDGFPVYQDLHDKIQRMRPSIEADPAMRAVFLPGGSVPAVGASLVQSDLARTLTAIARNGAAPMHSPGGAIAQDLEKYMRDAGGAISAADLAAYRVRTGPPLWGAYRGHKIAIMPPPSSGVFILEMLGMLETRDLRALYERDYNANPYGRPAGYEHFLAEVFRRGYADRAKLGGDPAFFRVPTELLVSPEYVRERAADIAMDEAGESRGLEYLSAVRQAAPEAFAARGGRHAESRETTHFSILDSRGDAVSSTQSVNVLFGARVMLPGWGIVLNDTMDDFSSAPDEPNAYGLVGGEANAIAAGKTPLSSMSPTIVFARPGERLWNGRAATVVEEGQLRPRLVLGSPGGSRIITAILHTIVNDVDFGLHPYASVARGRVHHQYLPDRLYFADSPAGRGRIAELEALGHSVSDSRWQAKVFAVRADAAGFVGVSDPRGDGRPVGDLEPPSSPD